VLVLERRDSPGGGYCLGNLIEPIPKLLGLLNRISGTCPRDGAR